MPKPSTQEPADRDRLLVRPLIDERARHLFGEKLQFLIDLSWTERWGLLGPNEDSDDDEPLADPDALRIFTECLSDLEAWIIVERARNASKGAHNKRRK